MTDWLSHHALASADAPALFWKEEVVSYAALHERVEEMARRLWAAGVRPGQHVAALLPNRPEFVVLIHALARLGAVLVPLNIRLTPAELEWQVANARCPAVVCSAETEPLAHPLGRMGRRLLSVDAPLGPPVEALAGYAPAAFPAHPFGLEGVQAIVFTSGTTGAPKGAMLTFANHFWSASASASRLGVLLEDRWLLCMPLYHVGGMAIVLRSCLSGAAIVLQERFAAGDAAGALETRGVTLFSLVPTMLQRLLTSHGPTLARSRVRCFLLGGAAPPPGLLDQALGLGLPVASTYGLTEASSQVATATPEQVRRKPGSVGRALRYSQVRIAGEAGETLGEGEVGEIVVRGPNVMAGYFEQPEATARAVRAGELFTGDLGYLDVDGDLWVVGRRGDLIVSGGENVYPAEVEAALLAHPLVTEACVVGVNDPDWGQQVAAAVVAGAGLDEGELLAFCRGRIAGYKLPRRIVRVDELPRTASGKVRRAAVREMFEKEAGRG